MKRKIKDLTVGEVVKVCKNQKTCYKCPLANTFCVFGTPESIKLRKKVVIKDETTK